MANGENLKLALEQAIQGLLLERAEADKLIKVVKDAEIQLLTTTKKLGEQFKKYAEEITEEYGDAIEAISDPRTFTILAESLTATELREAGADERIAQRFTHADTDERIEMLDLLPPAIILPLYALKANIIVTKLKTQPSTQRKAETTERIRAELLGKIKSASPELLHGGSRILRPNIALIEQAVKKEARELNDSNSLVIAFKVEGEYPDGRKWERDPTPEEAETYNGFLE